MRRPVVQRLPAELQEPPLLLRRRQREEPRHRGGVRVRDRDGPPGHGPQAVLGVSRFRLLLHVG